MFAQVRYLLRSKTDGQYLVARPRLKTGETALKYLLIFQEHFDALSYLNTHGKAMAENFAVESVSGAQLKSILQRWGFQGVGLVQDPLIPRIQFLSSL